MSEMVEMPLLLQVAAAFAFLGIGALCFAFAHLIWRDTLR